MTGRLDEIEAEALAALDFRAGQGQDPSYLKGNAGKQLDADLVLAFEELRAYRALRGELIGLVLTYIQESGSARELVIEAQIGRYYLNWISKRENL